ncbi:MAG: UDP-N-acetylmuramoyl-tripeptide--D-alanyl-D-alanine ligase [Bacteroidales bacterium]|nr:UDP-N-acetylmuramoyl-tripeptide--D-alanyl-D-alanine ligase [Bacteroidales bacterium]
MISTEQLYQIFKKHRSICTDSRRVSKDSIFFALKGDNFDGNAYAENALHLGCAYAVVDDPKVVSSDKFLLVKDALKALQDLAAFHRRTIKIPFVAITGTNGKTTTKELVSSVLAQKFRVIATKGNMNNHIGVPLTILSMNHTTDMGIIEMGASHQGDIAELCAIAQPDYGIITNVGKAHLEGFGSEEIIRKTKGELYDYLKQNNGVVFINGENPTLISMLGHYSGIKYGNTDDSFCTGKLTSKEMYVGIEWQCNDNSGLAISNLIGDYNFENILAAICLGNYFNISPTIIDKTIGSYTPSNNRSQWVRGRRNHLILDFYNANPTSMAIAIDNFMQYQAPKKCLILGDMLELGNCSESEHQQIISMINHVDYEDVFFVGENFLQLKRNNPFLFFENVETLNKYLAKNPPTGSLILVKGSRGIKLEKCIDYL